MYVTGGKLSMGDIHFSQGDGEISFCGAIEMSGYLDLHVDLIKGGVAKYAMVNPIFKPGPVEPHYSEYLVFEGISVDEFTGEQYYLDAHVSYRRACLNAIEYLKKFGFTGEQAYLLLSCAPVEGRVSGIVDIPNACCTLALPTGDLRQEHPPGLTHAALRVRLPPLRHLRRLARDVRVVLPRQLPRLRPGVTPRALGDRGTEHQGRAAKGGAATTVGSARGRAAQNPLRRA